MADTPSAPNPTLLFNFARMKAVIRKEGGDGEGFGARRVHDRGVGTGRGGVGVERGRHWQSHGLRTYPPFGPGPQQVWQTFPRGSAGLTPSNTVQRPYAVRTSYVSRCEFMYVPSAEVRDDEARVLVEKQRGSLDVCWARR